MTYHRRLVAIQRPNTGNVCVDSLHFGKLIGQLFEQYVSNNGLILTGTAQLVTHQWASMCRPIRGFTLAPDGWWPNNGHLVTNE